MAGTDVHRENVELAMELLRRGERLHVHCFGGSLRPWIYPGEYTLVSIKLGIVISFSSPICWPRSEALCSSDRQITISKSLVCDNDT